MVLGKGGADRVQETQGRSPLRPNLQPLPWGIGVADPHVADVRTEGRGGVRRKQAVLLSQHSDSDSDPESSALPPPIPSAVPVTGESFCDCDGQSEASFCSSLHTAHRGKDKDCRCGEEDERENREGGGRTQGWAGRVSLACMISSPGLFCCCRL